IEENSGNQSAGDCCPDSGAGGVATIYLLVVEPLIDEPRIVPKAADETIVLNVKISVNPYDVTVVIFVEERSAVTQFLLEPITHSIKIIAERVERRESRF